jgi:hypothetical protein
MRLVTMIKPMPPWQDRHDYALPDAAAERLIEQGFAVLSARHAESGLRPDSPPVARPASIGEVVGKAAAPVNRYLTRKAGRAKP